MGAKHLESEPAVSALWIIRPQKEVDPHQSPIETGIRPRAGFGVDHLSRNVPPDCPTVPAQGQTPGASCRVQTKGKGIQTLPPGQTMGKAELEKTDGACGD